MNDKKMITDDLILENREITPADLSAPVSVQLHKMTAAEWRDEAVEDYLNCCLCGSELTFTHVTHFVRLEVEEEAHCPSCRIRAKQNTYRLQ